MPKNLKEEIIFTLCMAGLMVFAMTIYNILLVNGLSTDLFNEIITGYPLGLIVALICDIAIVGPIAKAISFRYLIPQYMQQSQLRIGLTISILMVLGMVSCMSLFGVVVNRQPLNTYPKTWLFNIILALPIQMLIVGPISRKILNTIQLP
ncbi:DUF2798 domain-containing protein [Leuconostoc mesenteroides]|mgnify:CR=1 FL=1|uniref:DUF2798 domain-containing protein n=1 Tax=Leuconostoc mesenteroides TaxID=1245 RepID=UPI00235E883A|nr:DUF2798 domain-containing protein [Leuconostoc mesenteroides]